MIFKVLFFLFFVNGCMKNADQVEKSKKHKIQSFLRKHSLSKETFKKMTPTQAVMLANALVYKHCQNISPHEPEITNLFENCKTACGGYSYVLVETLKYLDFKPRFVNIYNVLNQGNHSLVEVELNGHHALLDPTFGTVFSKNGKLLSLHEVLSSKENELEKYVLQVKNKDFSKKNTNEIYHNSFYAQYMSLQSYLSFETFNVLDGRFVNLKLHLDLKNRKAREWKLPPGLTLDEKNAEYLRKTNETLNNSIEGDEVSYNFSFMGGQRSIYRNVLRLTNLKKYQLYKLVLEGDVLHVGQFDLTIVDGKASFAEDIFTAQNKGHFAGNFDFTPISENISILVEPHSKSTFEGRLWNISVEEKNE